MRLGTLLKPPALPAVDAGSIVAPSTFQINMLEPQAVDGSVSLYELFVINALVAAAGTIENLRVPARSTDEPR